MITKKVLFFFMVLSMAVSNLAQSSNAQSSLSQNSQAEWLRKIEIYMNASKTWEADFEQLNPNGSLYEGRFFLQRPGRMRLVYSYPKDQTMIADGTWLIIHDPSNDELTTLALKETPAEFFLRDRIDFSKGTIVKNFEAAEGLIRVTIVRADEPEAGSLTLTFSQFPLELIQWITVDANYSKTVINLKTIQKNKKYNPQFFTFNRPDLLRY